MRAKNIVTLNVETFELYNQVIIIFIQIKSYWFNFYKTITISSFSAPDDYILRAGAESEIWVYYRKNILRMIWKIYTTHSHSAVTQTNVFVSNISSYKVSFFNYYMKSEVLGRDHRCGPVAMFFI